MAPASISESLRHSLCAKLPPSWLLIRSSSQRVSRTSAGCQPALSRLKVQAAGCLMETTGTAPSLRSANSREVSRNGSLIMSGLLRRRLRVQAMAALRASHTKGTPLNRAGSLQRAQSPRVVRMRSEASLDASPGPSTWYQHSTLAKPFRRFRGSWSTAPPTNLASRAPRAVVPERCAPVTRILRPLILPWSVLPSAASSSTAGP